MWCVLPFTSFSLKLFESQTWDAVLQTARDAVSSIMSNNKKSPLLRAECKEKGETGSLSTDIPYASCNPCKERRPRRKHKGQPLPCAQFLILTSDSTCDMLF